MKYVVTGAAGFLGWHTRARLVVDPDAQVVALGRGDSPEAWAEAMAGADAVLHLAGLNRGEPDELEAGNLALAERLVAACEAVDARPAIVYAGSNYASEHHPGTDSPYGRGKRAAGQRLLTVTIRDDGVGGADPEGGGLQGLARRVAAIDGTVRVDSPRGGPTIITAELPCD